MDKVRLALGSLIIAIIGAAAQAQFQAAWAPWARWLTVAVLALILLTAFGYAAIWALHRTRNFVRERAVNAAIRDDVLAIARFLADSTNRNFALSAGSVLNGVHGAGKLSPELANEYGFHLATLNAAVGNVSLDLRAGRLWAIGALGRLVELNRDYLRLCINLVTAVAVTARSDIQRDWDGIRERANSTSERLIGVYHLINQRSGTQDRPIYFENVPRV